MFQWEFDILHFASFLTASVCVCVGGWRDRAPTSFISALLSPSLPVLIREPARQVLRRQVLRLTWSKWVGEPDYLGDTGQVWGKKWEIWGAVELLESTEQRKRIGRSWAEKRGRLREPFKNYLADFFTWKGGCGWGYPPFPLSFFGHNDFPLRGVGVPPNSVKEKIR